MARKLWKREGFTRKLSLCYSFHARASIVPDERARFSDGSFRLSEEPVFRDSRGTNRAKTEIIMSRLKCQRDIIDGEFEERINYGIFMELFEKSKER